MKRHSILIILLIILSTSACKKDFLDAESGRLIFRETYVKDLKTLQDFLGGTYMKISTNMYGAGPATYPDLIADDIRPEDPDFLYSSYIWDQVATEESSYGMGNSSPNASAHSYTLYGVITDASFVIEKAGEFRSENPEVADDIKGQALAIRALAHHWLVNVFAQPYGFTADASHPGVAYVTTYDWKNASPRRNTVAEVYTNLIDDLNNAIAILSTTSDAIRFNRNAAKALLARVYLYKGDYQSAKDKALEVANAVPIMVADYPAKLFTDEETESLFQLAPPYSDGTHYPGIYHVYMYLSATADITAIIRENPADKRNAWITPDGTTMKITKYPKDVDPNHPGESSYYPSVLRSSEMYLTLAECYAQLNDENNARSYLDQIRLRADASLAPSSATGPALLDSIYKERRKEHCFESFRMFDLLRLKKGVHRSDPNFGAPADLPYPSNKAIAPLPKLDIKLYGFPQNPGYN